MKKQRTLLDPITKKWKLYLLTDFSKNTYFIFTENQWSQLSQNTLLHVSRFGGCFSPLNASQTTASVNGLFNGHTSIWLAIIIHTHTWRNAWFAINFFYHNQYWKLLTYTSFCVCLIQGRDKCLEVEFLGQRTWGEMSMPLRGTIRHGLCRFQVGSGSQRWRAALSKLLS